MAASDILVNNILQRDHVKIFDKNNLEVFQYYFCLRLSHNLSDVCCLRLLFSYSLRTYTLYRGCHARKNCGYRCQETVHGNAL